MADHRRPESVLVVVYTEAAEALLLRRVQPFDFWQSVTGSLLPDETAAQCAARELREETGIRAGDDALLATGVVREFVIDPRWRNRYPPGVIRNLEHEFRLRLPGRCPVVLDRREHSDYQWLPVEEAAREVWSWTNRVALQALQPMK